MTTLEKAEAADHGLIEELAQRAHDEAAWVVARAARAIEPLQA